MEPTDHRALVNRLVEDLSWLEDHTRKQPELTDKAGKLRFAAALVRNVLGPYLDGQTASPLHVAVVGGAGAGKSTIVNFLCGKTAAEANPQAGFTRHPIVYVGGSPGSALSWSAHLGFLGPLRRLSVPSPSNLDQDVYQVRHVALGTAAVGYAASENTASSEAPHSGNGVNGTHEEPAFDLLHHFVVWDCPDMTTWAASGYVPRMLEVAGLADIVVYVASDERYNDVIPTQFLHLLIQAGKPVVVVITKMRENETGALVEHFRREVIGRLPLGPDGKQAVVPCLAIPFLSTADLTNQTGKAARHRINLVNQVFVLGEPAIAARKRNVANGLRFMNSAVGELLAVAKNDLEAIAAWRRGVTAGKSEFENRYRREYLTNEKFGRFDVARDRLLSLLDLPGAGKPISGFFQLLRAPYRFGRSALSSSLMTDGVSLPEASVLEGAFRGWLDQLRAEAIQNINKHPLWKHIVAGFESDLQQHARERFQQDVRKFEQREAGEIDASSRSVYEGLEKNPSLLNGLRTGKLAVDSAVLGAGLWLADFTWWSLPLAVVGAGVTHQIAELMAGQYVEHKREQTRDSHQAMLTQSITQPLHDWLCQWPVSGGSSFERLQAIVDRIPNDLRQLDALVRNQL